MSSLRALAPAKVNLGLFLGPVRPDGRHELVTLFESISLADELVLSVLPEGPDQVCCPGVSGPNLVSEALQELRRAGWDGPPVRIEIQKRIPAAAGLGGGSADAAAALRLAHAVAPVADGVAEEIAGRLGADVPSQLRPGLALGTGAGEVLEPLSPLAPHAFVVVPQPFELSTAEVYREADRLGLPRGSDELAGVRERIRDAAVPGGVMGDDVLVNDLEPAAISLAPALAAVLEAVGQMGVDRVLLCGSGPTVAGIYWGERAVARAHEAVDALAGEHPGAALAQPLVTAEAESVTISPVRHNDGAL